MQPVDCCSGDACKLRVASAAVTRAARVMPAARCILGLMVLLRSVVFAFGISAILPRHERSAA